ncbi:MAG: AEC family transporter [Deltaproteobacteria bacterium]|nr:AEC family transporter [Deltaproteobacteria bacterium]MBW2500615.1 AEC family transporter [Deltaproteobacteria bacterium]
MEVIWQTLVPVFAVVGVGYSVAARLAPDARTLANLALWVASPALIFSLLAGTTLGAGRLATISFGSLFILAVTALLALAYRVVRPVGRGFLLPVVFMNSGNMGLACARLAYGEAGLEAASVFFVVTALMTSLFGVWIGKGSNGLVEALRLPLLYGAVGGLLLAVTGVELPRLVMEPIEMLGAMAIPLMLINLGMQLRLLELSDLHHSLVAVALRMGGGLAAAALFVTLFGVSGVDRSVLILMSVMPAAVINVVIAQRYDTDPALVASSIVVGTMASLVSIPLALLMGG